MTKKLYFIFIFIFCIGNVLAAGISLSPPKVFLESNVGEIVCKDIFISVESPSELTGEVKWNNYGKSNSIHDYNYTSEELGLEVSFDENIILENKTKTTFCVNSKKKGVYNGAVLYRIKDKPLRAGIWIEANFTGNDFMKITGSAISVGDSYVKYPVVISSVLIVTLLGLVTYWKMRK